MSINTGTDISNLTPNTTYTFSVYPINANGVQTTATSVQFTTLPILTSASITSIDSSNQMTIGWSGTYYTVDVYYSTDDINYTKYNSSYNSSTKSSIVKPLSTNQRYYFRLDPSNSVLTGGRSLYIKDASAVTMGYISTFTAPTSDASNITLNWKGVYSNSIIYYGTTYGSTTYSTTISTASTSVADTNSIIIRNLANSTTYYFRIYPYNSYGTIGTYLDVSNATTLGYGTDPGTAAVWFKFDSRSPASNTITSETSVGSYTTQTITMNLSASTTIDISPTVTPITNRTGAIKSDGYLYTTSLSNQLPLGSYQSITVSFWVYPTSVWTGAGWMARIQLPSTTGTMDIMFRNSYTGMINGVSTANCFSINGTLGFGSNTYIGTNKWTHVCCVFNGSDNTGTFYINNTNIGSITGYYPSSSSSGTTSMIAVNYGSGGTGDFLKGYMSDYRIYKAALTASQVNGIYNFVW